MLRILSGLLSALQNAFSDIDFQGAGDAATLLECSPSTHKVPGLDSKHYIRPSEAMDDWNLSIQEVRLNIPGHPQLHEFKVSLGR